MRGAVHLKGGFGGSRGGAEEVCCCGVLEEMDADGCSAHPYEEPAYEAYRTEAV